MASLDNMAFLPTSPRSSSRLLLDLQLAYFWVFFLSPPESSPRLLFSHSFTNEIKDPKKGP